MKFTEEQKNIPKKVKGLSPAIYEQVLEVLEANYDDTKEKLVNASPENFKLLQGRATILREILSWWKIE